LITKIFEKKRDSLLEKKYYVGSYSAAIYWNLLHESDFTAQFLKDSPVLIPFSKRNFGLINIEKDGTQIVISNPTRTLIDLLAKPKLVTNIYLVEKALINYINSKHKNFDLMFNYASTFPSGAFYKRLGFLLERNYPFESELINHCLNNISRGYSYLDAKVLSDKIILKWNLWIPSELKQNI